MFKSQTNRCDTDFRCAVVSLCHRTHTRRDSDAAKQNANGEHRE